MSTNNNGPPMLIRDAKFGISNGIGISIGISIGICIDIPRYSMYVVNLAKEWLILVLRIYE